MSSLYLLLIPLSLLVLYRKVKMVIESIKNGNRSKLKADIFFLVLVIIIIVALVLAIEFI